jgi:hypothetical protein
MAALAAAVAAACLAAYRGYAAWLPPLQADETGHALPAARMAADLRAFDLAAFAAHTQAEMLWPFFHPWVLSAFFLVFGTSTEVGRASSIALFGLAMVLAALLARELHETSRPGDAAGVGLPSGLLMLLTAPFWTHSSLILIEPLGMSVTLAALIALAAAFRRPSVPAFALAGGLAALTFLTKYNYGLPLAAAIFASLAAARPDLRPARREIVALLGGLGLPVAAWLAYPFPAKLSGLYGFSVNRDEGLRGLEDLLFYPTAIAGMVSWPVLAWLAAAVALGLGRAREPRTSAAVFFVVLSAVMIGLHPNKQERYVLTTLPVAYVLGEIELRHQGGRLIPRRLAAPAGVGLVVALAFFLDPRPQLRDERDGGAALRGAQSIVDFTVEHVRPEERTLVLGSTGHLPHLLVQWELVVRKGARDGVVDALPFPGEEGWDSRYRQGYPTELTAEYEQALARALGPGGYDRVVTLQIPPGSAFMPDWTTRWDAWGQNYVALMVSQTRYPLVAQASFPESSVSVRVYERPAAGSRK